MRKFSSDPLWLESKKIARAVGFQDDWVTIIDCYHALGGKYVQLYAMTEDAKYRVVGLTDLGEVVLLNRKGEVVLGDYAEIFECRKTFFYNETPAVKEIQLPAQSTYNGSDRLSLYT